MRGEFSGVGGHLMWNQLGCANGFGHDLGHARAFHRQKPIGSGVNGGANGEQPVVLVDGSLALRKLRCDFFAGGGLHHYCATLFGDDHMVVIKITTVLGDRVEFAAKRGPRFAVHRVGMGC